MEQAHPTTGVAVESGGLMPPFGDSGTRARGLAVLIQPRDESSADFTRRVIARLRAVDSGGGVIARAVMVLDERVDEGSFVARSTMARAMVAAMRYGRSGSLELDAQAAGTPAVRARMLTFADGLSSLLVDARVEMTLRFASELAPQLPSLRASGVRTAAGASPWRGLPRAS